MAGLETERHSETLAPADRFIAGEERWATLAGYRMRYLYMPARTPKRPPIVLIHGLLGYSFSWRFNMEALAAESDVYAIDLLGMGYSERPPRGKVIFSLTETARRMLNWLKDTGLSGIDLLGTSHGGGLATMMAAIDADEHSGLIGRLILVAPMNPWSKVGLRRTRLLAHPLGAACFRATAPVFGIFTVARNLALDRMYGDPAKITPETRRGYDAMIGIPGTVDYALAIVRHWHEDLGLLKEVTPHITAPTLLIWGDRDGAVPVNSAGELKACLRKADLEVIRGAGHLPYEEAPDEFNRILTRWLASS